MNIAVCGSAQGEMSPHAQDVAKTLGTLIGSRGHTLITGACSGLPLDAARAARAEGGKVIGYSPARNIEEHKAWGDPVAEISEFVFLTESFEHPGNLHICRKCRNISLIAATDAAIFLAGRFGTLSEFTFAHDFGKPIGVLTETGGISDLLPMITEKIVKEPRPFIMFSDDPEEVVTALEQHCANL